MVGMISQCHLRASRPKSMECFPPAPPMVTIATFSKPEDAHLLRSQLESAGIAAFVKDDLTVQTYWLYSNAIGGVRVQINEVDLEAAHAFLNAPLIPPEAENA